MRTKNLVIALCLSWGASSLATPSPEVLDFSAAKLQTLSKTPTTVKEQFKAKVLILDFWASWCDPCKESLPFYEKLYKCYKDQGLEIMAVSVDDELKDATAFIEKQSFSFPFFWDVQRELSKHLKLQAVPTTLILDKEGRTLFRERGFVKTSKAKIESEVAKALGKPSRKEACLLK